jgi:CHAD domain-containing protein
MTDADKVTELHEMRKDCKKLRYLLELVPYGKLSDKNMSKLEEELQNMQDLLGAIHDCDAAVDHLKRQTKRQRQNDIIERIVQERKRRYEDLLVHFKSDITNNQFSSLLLSIPRRSN